MAKNILVAGGAGYIGSHTVVSLLDSGYDVIVVDNFSNSSSKALDRIKAITQRDFLTYECDCTNKYSLAQIFQKHKVDAIINFAGLKAVGESVQKPLKYYQNNLISAIVILELMAEYKVTNLIFSSSATVYGNPHMMPICEDFPLQATNPYGRTKLMIEDILRDFYNANPQYNIALLRYFNPIGAHPSGLIGEDPLGIPNNLLPNITQVAVGKRPFLSIYGDDYSTPDGTCIRDYIHVCDLADGHTLALNKLFTDCGLVTYNLGTGHGYSVYEVLEAVEQAVGKKIPYVVKQRRAGDIPVCYASCDKAYEELGFKAKYNLDQMASSAWNWQKNNPNGYN